MIPTVRLHILYLFPCQFANMHYFSPLYLGAYQASPSCSYNINGTLIPDEGMAEWPNFARTITLIFRSIFSCLKDNPDNGTCPTSPKTNAVGGAIYTTCPLATYQKAEASQAIVTVVNDITNNKAVYSHAETFCFYPSIDMQCSYSGDTGCLTSSTDNNGRSTICA